MSKNIKDGWDEIWKMSKKIISYKRQNNNNNNMLGLRAAVTYIFMYVYIHKYLHAACIRLTFVTEPPQWPVSTDARRRHLIR